MVNDHAQPHRPGSPAPAPDGNRFKRGNAKHPASAGNSQAAATWDAMVGPFYDSPCLIHILVVPLYRLEQLASTGEVLRTPTFDGIDLYPTFQFDADNALLTGLSDLLAVLDPEMNDPWGDALWLNAPVTRFEGRSAAEMMRERKFERVFASARKDRAKWDR